jgi:hypothetical protein
MLAGAWNGGKATCFNPWDGMGYLHVLTVLSAKSKVPWILNFTLSTSPEGNSSSGPLGFWPLDFGQHQGFLKGWNPDPHYHRERGQAKVLTLISPSHDWVMLGSCFCGYPVGLGKLEEHFNCHEEHGQLPKGFSSQLSGKSRPVIFRSSSQ